MMYIESFRFPGVNAEEQFVNYIQRTCYNSFYPFGVFTVNQLQELSFSEITILYGNNGSGKSTALNLMAEKMKAKRDTLFNRSSLYDDYLKMCKYDPVPGEKPEEIRMITSDDVFDFILNLRALNEGVDRKREQVFDEWIENKNSKFKMNSLDDYEQLKKKLMQGLNPSQDTAGIRLEAILSNTATEKVLFVISQRRSKTMACICWTSRRILFLRRGSWNYLNSFRIHPGSLDASSL